MLTNLAETPSNPKYRKLKTENEKVNKAITLDGATELLLAAGFKQADAILEVPGSDSDADVGKRARQVLAVFEGSADAALAADINSSSSSSSSLLPYKLSRELKDPAGVRVALPLNRWLDWRDTSGPNANMACPNSICA